MGTAVVTGASSGLGRELCVLLAERGERVVAVARSADALSDLAASSPRVSMPLRTRLSGIGCSKPAIPNARYMWAA